MSFNIKQRLWSLVRDPAKISTPCRTGWSQRPQVPRWNFTQIPKRSFSWSRPRSQRLPPTKTTITKSFASGSFLFVDLSPASAVPPAISACATTAEKTLHSATTRSSRPVSSLARQTWRREIHSSTRRRERGSARRNQSSKANGTNGRKLPQNASKVPPIAKNSEPIQEAPKPDPPSSHYLHLPHMPKLPHRPTKEELLAAATGFWSRLKVRFKWFSIRSARPWNIDDWSAFVSWFVLGNIVWILVGTTTFFSLVIFSINTVVAQGRHLHLSNPLHS